jgi:hypothetical protein
MSLKKVYTVDILLNVAAPLLIGSIPYLFHITLPAIIKNHLPDGLWAYAFTSLTLIIWTRTMNWFWLCACLLSAILFEAFQYFGFVQGDADILDIVTYFLFFAMALQLNKFFKSKYITHHV